MMNVCADTLRYFNLSRQPQICQVNNVRESGEMSFITHFTNQRPWLRHFGILKTAMKKIHNLSEDLKYCVQIMKQEAWQYNKLHCNHLSRPRNRAFGAHHCNTPKITPSEHVKQHWCETSGELFRKWLKTWNDPEIGSLRPIFNTPLKVAEIDMET